MIGGLLSMFGATPETVQSVKQGLLDFGDAFPRIRRQRLEEQAMAEDRDWLKKQRQAQMEAAAAQQETQRRRMNYFDAVSPTMGPPMEVDPARAIANGITTQELGALMPKKPELFGNVNPSDFTPQSLARFQQSGNYADLMPKPTEQKMDEFGAILINAGIKPGTPEWAAKYRELAARKVAPPQGMQISLLGPTAGLVDGVPTLVQPPNRPGQPTVPLIVDGKPVRPMPAGGGAASEDERKAAGWFNQANNAYQNMLKILQENPNAAKPNIGLELTRRIPLIGEPAANAATPEPRQRFEQAASSFAEAALRAATGAGVTKDEAAQKIKELTPQWGDKPGTIAQKARDMQVYLQSLKTRAGRAAVQTPAANVLDEADRIVNGN